MARNVFLLGLVSLFTDISSEMVATVLPLYLVYSLGLSPLQFGVVDGIQQGGSALVRLASGYIADRRRNHKQVAAAGYGISAVSRIAFLGVGSAWGGLAGVVMADRTGKGIRTAPRDALISLSSREEELGTAFGVHRALDTAGAMMGPLVAFGLLALSPLAFDSIFVVSFCTALVGLAILVFLVENREAPRAESATAKPVSLRGAAGLFGAPQFRLVVLCGGVLSLATMSDGFLYLSVQRRLAFDFQYLPLLYVGTALVYMLLALPMGRLADRVGRTRVFLGGYALLLLVYGSLLLPRVGVGSLALFLLLLGTYYAATEGVLMALTSSVVPPELRASGLSLVVTVTTLARLVASILFGALWTFGGVQFAVIVFAVALVVGLSISVPVLRRTEAGLAR